MVGVCPPGDIHQWVAPERSQEEGELEGMAFMQPLFSHVLGVSLDQE